MSLPMLALKSANLVSGVPEAQYGGGLAGVIDVATLDPTEKPSFEWRWQTDGGLDTRYDRVGARGSAPLGVLGLGAMAAVDATFDDTWLPALRTKSQHEVAGIPLGWRAENRMLYYLKLAPVAHPSRFDLQAAASRQVHEPFDPMWSLDGWTMKPTNGSDAPVFSPDSLPGYDRFIAADRLGIAEDDHFAALLSVHRLGDGPQGHGESRWFRTRSVYSFGGGTSPESRITPASAIPPTLTSSTCWAARTRSIARAAATSSCCGATCAASRDPARACAPASAPPTSRSPCARWIGCRSASIRAAIRSPSRSTRCVPTRRMRRADSPTQGRWLNGG